MNEYLTEELALTVPADQIAALFIDEPGLAYLDSSSVEAGRGRYSFIGFDPFEWISLKGRDAPGRLRKRFSAFKKLKTSAVTPLPAGMVGALNYDFGFPLDKIEKRSDDDCSVPDAVFGLYDCMITLDHRKEKVYITSTGLPEKEASKRKKRALDRCRYILNKLSAAKEAKKSLRPKRASNERSGFGELQSNFTKKDYCRSVEKALDYIGRGDIYQVNLSQRFQGRAPGTHGLDIYFKLKEISRSCYGGYFKGNDFQIISSSPEQFLKVKDGTVTTRPMKGTRPRGSDEIEDHKFKEEILKSEKDKAELLMVTDLERNDLGKVCEYGTVCVDEMRTIEVYDTVFQATSSVSGKLQEAKDCFDVIEACFPGGSITGCPKLRAMSIIEELEPTRRGFYTGSMGYVSFTGEMELNILIRTLVVKGGRIYFQVGGGIVADSIPQKEYEETLVKARAMKKCLEQLEGKKADDEG